MSQVTGDAGVSAPLFPDKKSGVWGQSDNGYGVAGTAVSGNGLQGGSVQGFGAVGTSDDSTGVIGISTNATGVHGISHLAGELDSQLPAGIPQGGTGVYGQAAAAAGVGVRGEASGQGIGVLGLGQVGMHGEGVFGVVAIGTGGTAVLANSDSGHAVAAYTKSGEGAFHGMHGNGAEVWLCAHLTADGRLARGSYIDGDFIYPEPGMAGEFFGDVVVAGQVLKQGGGFRIDHPLYPAERFLLHSFVESSERKNLYDGTVVLDTTGRATVEVPAWFEALNEAFRYQLTPIGAAAPGLHIAQELNHRRFTIAGGAPDMQVCWQVTGVRKDPWAQANRLRVEQDKCNEERGYFLSPEVYHRSREYGIQHLRRRSEWSLSDIPPAPESRAPRSP